MPVLLDCNFVVDNTNASGITSLKGPYIKSVYMNTSATPTTGSPNPAAGTIVVNLSDNYNKLYSKSHAIVSPTSGSAVKIDNSALTAGVAYIITTVGDSTAAVWHAVGLPAGITPAVGASFVALTVGAGSNASTSRVMAAATAGSTVATIEIVGNADIDIAPSPSALPGPGGQILLQCRDYAGALVAPVAGSKIMLSFLLSNSSVLIQGE